MTTIANTEKAIKAISATGQNQMVPGNTLKAMLDSKSVKTRFEEMLGKKAAGFMSSILSAASMNKQLATADPMSVISAAAVAASLDLPINPSLGFAHIVPYSGQAQFQLGWRGLVQLAQRTGQYLTMNVSEVYEGQLVKADPFTGAMEFDADAKKSDKIVGYVAYFKLINGFEKYSYWTVEKVTAHGKRYSKSFDYATSRWKQDFDAMAKKTVLKGLLSKWGVMSIEMQKAAIFDQAAVTPDEKPQYIDSTTAQPDAVFEPSFVEERPNGADAEPEIPNA